MAIPGLDSVQGFNHPFVGPRKTEERVGDPQRTTGQRGGVQSDSVAISSELRERQALIDRIHALPDIRLDKISPVQDALVNGRLEGKGDRVAAGIIKETFLDAVT